MGGVKLCGYAYVQHLSHVSLREKFSLGETAHIRQVLVGLMKLFEEVEQEFLLLRHFFIIKKWMYYPP